MWQFRQTFCWVLVVWLSLPTVLQAQDYTYMTNSDHTIAILWYNGAGGDVILPDSFADLLVTSIEADAFEYTPALTSVVIPNSITNIEWEAFIDCQGLTNVTFGSGVRNIGIAAFEFCPHLARITVDATNPCYSSINGVVLDKAQTTLILCPEGVTGGYTVPGSVTRVGSRAFGECAGLTDVLLPNGVVSLGEQAFEWCTSLTNVTFPASITNIGNAAFYGCSGLTEVSLSNGIVAIGDQAFGWCSSLTNVTLPASVATIGDAPFVACASLTAITVDVTNAGYCSTDGVLFDKAKATLIQCPTGKTGNYAIPDSVTQIGSDAFYQCIGLTNLTIGTQVVNIADSAFYACTNLIAVTIPASVTSIGDRAFRSCVSLRAIYFLGNAPSLGGALVFFAACRATVYYLPGTTGWNTPTFAGLPAILQVTDYDCSVTNGTITIVQYTGSSTNLTSPDTINGLSVTGIGEQAFENCTNLLSMTISTNVTSIGDWAFAFCTRLVSIRIPDRVTCIGDDAFYWCHSLTNLFMPSALTNIGARAFRECADLSSVTIPASVTSIGVGAFDCCYALQAITVDENNMFYSSVEGILFDKNHANFVQWPTGKSGSYTIPPSVTNVGSSAFFYCDGITRISLTTNVVSIGDYAFACCGNLRDVYCQGNAPILGTEAFAYANYAIVYCLPGTTGWGTFDGPSPVLWNPQVMTDGSFGVRTNCFGFTITNAGSPVVVIEACTNLAGNIWIPVATNTLTGGSAYFSDPQWANFSARFYRFQSP